jgi:hypothetical protein
MVGGVFPIRSQLAVQTEYTVQLCLAEPAVTFAMLALGSVDLQARTGHLSDESIQSKSTEGELSHRKVPAFMGYKFKAMKAVNEKIASGVKAAEILIIVVLMTFSLVEVRARLIFPAPIEIERL